jgi:ATP diphosphatase
MSDVVNTPLNQALAIQQKCAKQGFDWPDATPVFDKVIEELNEVKAELATEMVNQLAVEDEVGDLFFAAVNLARHLNVDPDTALTKATAKFNKRFSLLESFAAQEGVAVNQLSLDELELLWLKAKQCLRT